MRGVSLFKILIFSCFLIANYALAADCTPENQGAVENCGTCGWRECICKTVNSTTICNWSACHEASKPPCQDREWDEYKCEDKCGAKKYKRHVLEDWEWESCACQGSGKDRYWKCTNCRAVGKTYTPSKDGEIVGNCEGWQKCEAGWEDWKESENLPLCECKGVCLEIPKNPRYYDNPEYPTDPFNPEAGKPSDNIFLPVKFDWNDVKGWKGGWIENGKAKTCTEKCAQSYRVRFGQTTKDGYSTNVEKSEYNYREDPSAGACFLKSGLTQNWYVKACCNADGTNCGQESPWQFTTNAAPEPIEPEDPDWAGSEKKEGLPLDVTLRWCESDFKYPEYEKPLSYGLRLYQIVNQEEICHPELEAEGECYPKLVVPEPPGAYVYPPPEFPNEKYNFFTKDTSYAWEVVACKDRWGNDCTDYSQRWRFSIIGELGKPNLYHPPNDPAGNTPVGFPVVLKWEGPFGAKSWIVQVSTKYPIKTPDSNISFNYGELSLDTLYNWKVQPCWDYEAKDCENIWSDTRWFRTTGRPPKLGTMKPEGVDISIPVIFEWEDVPGAKSYRIKIWGDGLNLEEPVDEKATFSLDYPKVKQLTNYSWQVATCALENGSGCGQWNNPKSFKTFKLGIPTNPSPKDDEEIFTYQMPKTFSWDSVPYARYYKYTINYIKKSAEEVGDCPAGEVIGKIVSNNSDLVSLNCLGEYQWQVQACLDEKCEGVGDWSNLWSFTLSQKIPPGKGGLVPCGRDYDDPNTPWNEREHCQIKHLFLMIKIIVDFLLWRVGLIILVLLVIATAIIYYFSMGAPGIIINVKSLWKSAGIGYGIIFLAWIIVNLFLLILGYKIEIFGRWWEIQF